MPNFGMLPQGTTLLALATTTTSGTSAALTLPPASSYRLLVQVQTVSGTLPTLQVIVATSCDAGTTYNEILSYANLTTSGQGRQMMIRPYLGIGDVATVGGSALLGTADLAAGDLVNNGPIVPGFIKIRWVHGGTTPSFAWQLQLIAVPQDLSD
jgi:hypothetical protein